MEFRDRNYIQDARSVGVFSTRVYGWMAIGLSFTAAVAFFLYHSGLYVALMPFWLFLSLGTFGVAMAINVGIQRFSLPAIMALFLTYSGLQGLLFGTLLPAFAAAFGGQLIWTAFLSAGVVFSLAMGYGLMTKNDLTSIGRILTFALIGLVATSLIFMILSFVMPLGILDLLISYVGLAIFVGLTAYDAQTIRRISMQVDVQSAISYKLSLILALQMYINVIMIFWYLLRILSFNRR